MNNRIDQFAAVLLEQAKRFAELAADSDADGKAAYLNAALMVGFGSLEAHVNSIADDFALRDELSVHDRGILFEKEIRLENGEFKITDTLKMIRLEDRIQFICLRLSGKNIDRTASWWSELSAAMKLRNKLTHPKEATPLTEEIVQRALRSMIDTLDHLYKMIYKTGFPAAGMGLQSKLDF